MNSINILLHFLKLQIASSNTELLQSISSFYHSYDQTAIFSDQIGEFKLLLESFDSKFKHDIPLFDDGVLMEFSLSGYPCYFKDGIFLGISKDELDKHVVEINLLTRTVRANLSQRFFQHEEALLFDFMRDILHKIVFPTSGLLPLHGGVVAKGKQAVFLSGDKGFGKSTLSLKLLELGYTMLADDSPLFTLLNGKTVALSSLDKASVTEQTLELLPYLKPFSGRRRELSNKYMIDRTFFQNEKESYGPVSITDFIRLAHGTLSEPQLEEIDQMTALTRLFQESMILFRKPEFLDVRYGLEKTNRFIFNVISGLFVDTRCLSLTSSFEQIEDAAQLINALE